MENIFSIIIPSYNAEDSIAGTLDSVVCQDKEIYEIVVVDGGSEDDTINIVCAYKKIYPYNIKYVSEKDRGIYDAMNKGIGLARGEYLYFLGSGDVLRKNILSEIKSELEFQPELVYGNIFHERFKAIFCGKFDNLKLSFHALPHQAAFYNKSVFDIIGNYNIKYKSGGDQDLNIRCFGSKIIKKKYIDVVVANYDGYGFSSIKNDDDFDDDKSNIILHNLGEKYYRLYMHYSSYRTIAPYSWINERFVEFVQSQNESSVIIFGAGSFGVKVFEFVEEYNERELNHIEIKYFMDNSQEKWNKKLCNIDVVEPERSRLYGVDKVIVASMPGRKEIYSQLLGMGVSENKIISVP